MKDSSSYSAIELNGAFYSQAIGYAKNEIIPTKVLFLQLLDQS